MVARDEFSNLRGTDISNFRLSLVRKDGDESGGVAVSADCDLQPRCVVQVSSSTPV